MGLIATKKQNRYQLTCTPLLGVPVAFLWRLSGHNPRDQDNLIKPDKVNKTVN